MLPYLRNFYFIILTRFLTPNCLQIYFVLIHRVVFMWEILQLTCCIGTIINYLTYPILNIDCFIQVIFEMDLEGLDEDQQEQLKNLWKIYGRESKMGKQLFALYNKAEKPKIQYPKVRPKSEKQLQAQKLKAVVNKKCPQKTVIQYPEMPVESGTKFYPIDFIPKRKAESVIRQEIQQYKRKRSQMIPANRGVDRALLVKKLQEKFNMKGGILPKGATLPSLEKEVEFNEQQIKQKAKLRVQKKFKNYSEAKKQPLKPNNTKPNDQLDELFQQIVQQIEDRQQYLDSIDHLDEPQIKTKIKRQMIERIAELQRITQLKKN